MSNRWKSWLCRGTAMVLFMTMFATDTLTYVSASSGSSNDSSVSVEQDSGQSDEVANLIRYNEWRNKQRNDAIKIENGIPVEKDTEKDSNIKVTPDKKESDTENEKDTEIEVEAGGTAADESGGESDVKSEGIPVDEDVMKFSELLVKTDDKSLVDEDKIVSEYDDTYLLTYDSVEEASEAYTYYSENVSDGFVSQNNTFGVATNDEAPSGDEIVYEKSALESLEDALSEKKKARSGGKNVIALIDTGVSEDADVVDAVSMFGGLPWDDNGHGTKMYDLMNREFESVDILSIKALNEYGCGDVVTLYAAIEYAIAQKVSVINLSLVGRRVDGNMAIVAAIEHARAEGILVVGAAGNFGENVNGFVPANMEDIYVIGSADEYGRQNERSNYGATVDYNVTASSTSEAAAIFSANLAKVSGDITALDDGKDKSGGWLFSTDYKDDMGNFTGGSSGGNDEGGFFSQFSFVKDGLSSASGYDFRINDVSISGSQENFAGGFSLDYIENCTQDNSNKKHDRWLYMANIKGLASGKKKEWSGVCITTIFPDGVIDGAGNLYDLKMVISDVTVFNNSGRTFNKVCIVSSPTERSKKLASDTWGDPSNGMHLNAKDNIGVRFDCTMSVLDSAGNPVSSGTLLYGFKDLDQPGKDGSYDNWRANYVEGVNLISGFNGPLHVNHNSQLKIDDNKISGKVSTEDGRMSAFTCLVNASGWKFKWSGHACGTSIVFDGNANDGFVNHTVTVTASGPGSASPLGVNRGLITGQNLPVSIVPNAHAHIASVTVDGVAQPNYVGWNAATSYGFTNIRADHSIHIVFENDIYQHATYVRYQGADGNYGDYALVDAQNIYYGYYYSYAWVRPATAPTNVYKDAVPASIYALVVNHATHYMDVPRYQYTYSFNLNPPLGHGTSEITGGQADITKYAENLSGAVSSPSLTGYVFKGWNTSINGNGTAYTSEAMLSDKTFYAIWEPLKYYVVYDDNNESNPNHETGEFTQNVVTTESGMPTSTFYYDRIGKLRKNDFVRSGYRFVGWNTKADGTGTSYPDEYARVYNWTTTPEATITLYAQWEKELGQILSVYVSEETGAFMNSGTSFELYKKVNGTWVKMYDTITDDKGRVYLTDLHWFDYELRSKTVPAGYVKPATLSFRINDTSLSIWKHNTIFIQRVRIVLNSRVSDIIRGEEAPAFMYEISGTDAAGVQHKYSVMVQTDGGSKFGTNSVADVMAGNYMVKQVPVQRYIPGNAQNVANATPSGSNANVNVLNNTRAEVLFPYTMNQYGGFSHTDGVKNSCEAR